MTTGATPPTGRERRRKGPINRIRRFLYGILLLAAAPGAAPADELAYVGKFRAETVAAAPYHSALVVLQGLLTLHVNAADEPDVALDTVTAQLATAGDQAPQFRIGAERIERNEGAEFELPVADFGSFHLGLLPHYSEELSGWSLAGTLELVRAGAERLVATVPQLRIATLHASETRYLAFEALVRRKMPSAKVQLDFRWRI